MDTGREDKVKQLSLSLQKRKDLKYKRVINLLLTYDKSVGLCAHLVVEIAALEPFGRHMVYKSDPSIPNAVALSALSALSGLA